MEELKIALKLLWDEVDLALSEPKHPWHLPSLSTISESGPQQRTVVLRDVTLATQSLVFFTDYRSAKVAEITKDNRASVLLYHPQKKWQLRLQGPIKLHYQNAVSSKYFNTIPVHRLGDYESALSPGSSLMAKTESLKGSAPEHFAVLEFKTMSLDFLRLLPDGHLRLAARYSNEGKRNFLEAIQA
jgi:pyridoxamine 5'-phosphate oxidase